MMKADGVKADRLKAGRNKGSKQRSSRGPLLSKLLQLLMPHKWEVSFVSLMLIGSTAMGLATPWLLRYSIDSVILVNRLDRLWLPVVGMVVIAFLAGFLSYLQRYRMEQLGQKIVLDLRLAAYRHFSRLSFTHFDHSRTGDIVARLTSDADILNRFFGFFSITVVANILTLLGILIVLMSWSLRLALVYVFLIPLMIHAMRVYATQVRPVFTRARRSLSRLTERLQQSLEGIEVVKTFGQEGREHQRLVRQATEYLDTNVEGSRISAKWMPYVSFLMGIATAFVVWYGGRLVIEGQLSLGTLVGFTGYIGLLLRPIRQTGMMVNMISRSMAAGERVFEILETEPDVGDRPGAYPLPPVQGLVRLDNVSFSYDGDSDVLRGITFSVEPGETVALVGPSGAGKSTLVHLLARFYQLEKGTITVDGHDIAGVTLKSLRSQIGIIMQDVFLFDATVAENIAFGRPEATMAEITWAARTAQIHDFIQGLPGGYGSRVGEQGVRLSGGQRQRIAMARVLLTDPRLLIMDEPTSHMDVGTEDKIQQALQEVIKGRTVFIIAHRLWSVRFADRIVVLDRGRVVEEGPHHQLAKAGGLYQRLYELQQDGPVQGGDTL